jgi:hypothetical protein
MLETTQLDYKDKEDIDTDLLSQIIAYRTIQNPYYNMLAGRIVCDKIIQDYKEKYTKDMTIFDLKDLYNEQYYNRVQ